MDAAFDQTDCLRIQAAPDGRTHTTFPPSGRCGVLDDGQGFRWRGVGNFKEARRGGFFDWSSGLTVNDVDHRADRNDHGARTQATGKAAIYIRPIIIAAAT